MASVANMNFTVSMSCIDTNHDISSDQYNFICERVCDVSTIVEGPHAAPPPTVSRVLHSKNLEHRMYIEKGFPIEYNAPNIAFSENDMHTVFYGYFQNENYFAHAREKILEMFREPPHITTFIRDKYRSVKFEDFYFLHVRLGDYTAPKNISYHWVDLRDYYNNAIEHIKRLDPEAKFLISTENPELIGKYYPGLVETGSDNIILNENNHVINFYMLSRCLKGGICANSTYSWWGAWLNSNPKKIVTIPSKWFPHRMDTLNMTGSVVINV